MTEPLVVAEGLTKRHTVRTRTGRRVLTAVDGVDPRMDAGRILAVVACHHAEKTEVVPV